MGRRIVSIWFDRMASDLAQRRAPLALPGAERLAIIAREGGAERLRCLTRAAEAAGLSRGMGLADARALCPGLLTRPADPAAEAAGQEALLRWAGRYSPLVGREGEWGLVLDVTGVPHLFGGEEALLEDLASRLVRMGLSVRAGLAGTRGAAWALARFAARPSGPGGGGWARAAEGEGAALLDPLPPAALRLDPATCEALDRLGLRRIADLRALPRAGLARRFGPALVMRLDQALGAQPESVAPEPEPPHFGARLTLPEPIGLRGDIDAGLARLLERLCARLEAHGQGARRLALELRRTDGSRAEAEIGLARPMRDARRMAALFDRALQDVDAGFGIETMRLTAPLTEPMRPRQMAAARLRAEAGQDGLADLMTRLGNRVGFEALTCWRPAESHIPERSFLTLSAAEAAPSDPWPPGVERPVLLFAPEPLTGAPAGAAPPRRFRWRRRDFAVIHARGPERIAPEWWFDDPAWRSGPRDYWKIETAEGPRLWLFHTPLSPGWAVQGAFA